MALRVHRVASCDTSSGAVVTRSDTGLASDPSASRHVRKGCCSAAKLREESLTPCKTRFVHPLRVIFTGYAPQPCYAFAVLPCFSPELSPCLSVPAFLAPAVHAQTADLQLTQTASALRHCSGFHLYLHRGRQEHTSSATVTAGTITVYMQTPPNTTYQSYYSYKPTVATHDWTCTNPGANNVGPVVCSYGLALASGATATQPHRHLPSQPLAPHLAPPSLVPPLSRIPPTWTTFRRITPASPPSLSKPTTSADLGVSMSVSPLPFLSPPA